MSVELVELWDTHEVVFTATHDYTNPFVDVIMTVAFFHEDTHTEITADAFYDGDRMWKVRFLPQILGSWRYRTTSSESSLDGISGRLTCTAPTQSFLRSPLHPEQFHFRHADGTWRYLISTRLSCHLADEAVIRRVVTFLKTYGINRVLFMMGGISGTVKNLYGPNLDFSRYNLSLFRRIDLFTDILRRSDILASPYLYYFNDRDQCGMTIEDDHAYVTYAMARLGAYANLMPCLSNQVEGKFTHGGQDRTASYDPRNWEWANLVGRHLKEKAVFGVPVTVHNPLESKWATRPSFYTLLLKWPFHWTDFMARQVQVGSLGSVAELSDDIPEQFDARVVTGGAGGAAYFSSQYNPRAYAQHNSVLTALREFDIPVINEEPGYELKGQEAPGDEMNPVNWNSQTSETLLPTIWTAATAGAYGMWGSSETYNLDDPLPGLENSVVPQYLEVLRGVLDHLPFWEMEPCNQAVSPSAVEIEGEDWRTNFCLSKKNENYLVFSLYGGRGSLTLPDAVAFIATCVNPRTGTKISLGQVHGPQWDFRLPRGEWVMLAERLTKAPTGDLAET